MKIAALVVLAVCILTPVILFSVYANMGPDETKPSAGMIIRVLVVDVIALSWAIRTLKKELQKEKLIKELRAQGYTGEIQEI